MLLCSYRKIQRNEEMNPINKKVLHNVLKNAFDDMIFIMQVEHNGDFTYAFFNQAVREKLSFTDEQIGQSISDIYDSE